MKNGIAVVAVVSSLTAACQTARPPSVVPASLLACSRLHDPGERVRCYDTQIAALNRPATATRTPPAAVPSGPAPAAAGAAPTPATPAASAAAAPAAARVAGTGRAQHRAPPAAAADQSLAAQFGAEQLPPALRPPEPERTMTLVSRITGIDEVQPNLFVISLANGQVWLQDGAQVTRFFRVGDTARIERGILGSYHMWTALVGAKNWARVRRIR